MEKLENLQLHQNESVKEIGDKIIDYYFNHEEIDASQMNEEFY